jgi:hypothetical protein
MTKTLSLLSLLLLTGTCAMAKPLKVYILSGQSNMEGHAAVRTFDHIGMDPKTAPMLENIRDKSGKPVVVKGVYISYLTGAGKPMKPTEKQGQLTVGFGSLGKEAKIGPEFTFGLYLHKHLNEPILIIKTAWGGKSLYSDFYPPNATEGQEQTEATGHYYRLMIEHVKKVLADPGKVHPAYKKSDGYEIAGFVWFQGWNDMVNGKVYPNREKPGGYDLYSTLMAQFIRDVRKDLSAPKMHFAIGVMGTGGPTKDYESPRYKGVHQSFRDAMAAPSKMPEFKGTVTAVLTEKYWDKQLADLAGKMSKTVGGKLKEAQKSGELKGLKGAAFKEARGKLEDKLKKENFTAEELKILQTGKSNAGFHYMGSSKVLAQIGKAFADAMAETLK